MMKANLMPKDINPNKAKLKAAIRIMVKVALRILEKDKHAGLNPTLTSCPPELRQQRRA